MSAWSRSLGAAAPAESRRKGNALETTCLGQRTHPVCSGRHLGQETTHRYAQQYENPYHGDWIVTLVHSDFLTLPKPTTWYRRNQHKGHHVGVGEAIPSTNHKGVIIALDFRWSTSSRTGMLRENGSTSTHLRRLHGRRHRIKVSRQNSGGYRKPSEGLARFHTYVKGCMSQRAPEPLHPPPPRTAGLRAVYLWCRNVVRVL
jgi:hypothetical protein